MVNTVEEYCATAFNYCVIMADECAKRFLTSHAGMSIWLPSFPPFLNFLGSISPQ